MKRLQRSNPFILASMFTVAWLGAVLTARARPYPFSKMTETAAKLINENKIARGTTGTYKVNGYTYCVGRQTEKGTPWMKVTSPDGAVSYSNKDLNDPHKDLLVEHKDLAGEGRDTTIKLHHYFAAGPLWGGGLINYVHTRHGETGLGPYKILTVGDIQNWTPFSSTLWRGAVFLVGTVQKVIAKKVPPSLGRIPLIGTPAERDLRRIKKTYGRAETDRKTVPYVGKRVLQLPSWDPAEDLSFDIPDEALTDLPHWIWERQQEQLHIRL